MAYRKKIVMVPSENVDKLAAAHGITRGAVYNMLAFRSDSHLAQLVRKQAVDMYGGVNTTKMVL